MKDPVSQAYKTFNEAIDRVLKHSPGPARWRACVNMWLTFPGNKTQYQELIKENAKTRELVDKHGRALGVSKSELEDKTLRNSLALPHYLYYLIQRADPMAFREKRNAKLMFNELREFTTRRVY